MIPFTIGDVSVKPGTKWFDYLKVEDATTLRTFQYKTVIGPPRQRTVLIPLMIVHGLKPGPTLCINAGVHATEYTGIEAIIRLFKDLDPTKIEGTLLLLPIVNIASFWTMTPYINIQDGVDISSVYGRKGDTVSFLIANTIMEKIFCQSDLIIDFHAGDLLEELLPHCGFTRVGEKKLDSKTEMYAKAFGLEVIHVSETQVREGRYKLEIPQIYVEIGCCGKLEEKNVRLALNGINNIMKKIKMIKGDPSTLDKFKIMKTGDYIYSSSNGFFHSKANVGDEIKKGQFIGEVINIRGEIIEKIIAPSDGIIFLKMFNPVKLAGDLIYKCIKYIS